MLVDSDPLPLLFFLLSNILLFPALSPFSWLASVRLRFVFFSQVPQGFGWFLVSPSFYFIYVKNVLRGGLFCIGDSSLYCRYSLSPYANSILSPKNPAK